MLTCCRFHYVYFRLLLTCCRFHYVYFRLLLTTMCHYITTGIQLQCVSLYYNCVYTMAGVLISELHTNSCLLLSKMQCSIGTVSIGHGIYLFLLQCCNILWYMSYDIFLLLLHGCDVLSFSHELWDFVLQCHVVERW